MDQDISAHHVLFLNAVARALNTVFGPYYDIEFPEPARVLAEAGAEVILVPTAIDHGGSYVPEVLVRARAAENGITIAYANHAGTSA